MARRYYDTPQRVFQLFKNHPALSQLYSEFGIEIDGIKRVSEFLVLNHDKIETYDLKNLYNSQTPNTLESDQDNPVSGQVEEFINLPTTNLEQGDIYFVQNPYPGKYYIWNGINWIEDDRSKEKSRIQYLDQLYQEHGHKVWEDESGFFIAIEESNSFKWEKVEIATPDRTVIRKSQLPSNPTIGEVYEVLGEDLIDIIASLYGLVDYGMTPPWNQYQSSQHTNLQELLNITIYLYRYGVTDNFYETNIWDFIPEYDREQMQALPKIKLFMESLGRKLDQIEDKLNRLEDVYDIDEVPEEMLDHLGQMLGYEKEDFSLSSVSFRELLKNIIEIYKIKGTNYSFSFFFKFLGFNVNLKEFYFNRDVRNPEAFPGMDVENVEYYLTTTNPIQETVWGNPAPYLDQIRSLNDWQVEYDALLANGCENPINYMLGKEAYNNGSQWHANPWKYFKTNLIEYELNPFFDKVNLTSSDNETIRKYIRFLSPTYLFTWINVNLLPWVESFSVSENVIEYLTMEIEKTFGDTENGEWKDYEELEDYLQVWDETKNMLVPYTEADTMFTEIERTFGQTINGQWQDYDQVGAYLRHDGVYIRQPGHPSHITNVFHDGSTRLNFDNLGIMLKPNNQNDWDDLYPTLADMPQTAAEYTVAFVEETGLYYMYKDPAPYWMLIESEDEIPNSVDQDHEFNTYTQLQGKVGAQLIDGTVYKVIEEDSYYIYHNNPSRWELVTDFSIVPNNIDNEYIFNTYYQLLLISPPIVNDIYRVLETNRYYRYIDENASWVQTIETQDRYYNWLDYSYRPFPSYPINVTPSPGVRLKINTINFVWDEIYAQQGYWIQVAKNSNFSDLKHEEFIHDGKNYVQNLLLENDNYFWRVRTRNNLQFLQFHQDKIAQIEDDVQMIISAGQDIHITQEDETFAADYFIFDGVDTYTVRPDLSGIELNKLIEIFSATGNIFHWNSWSSIFRFEVYALPFPHNGQVIDDVNYQYIKPIRDEFTNELVATQITLEWEAETNIESYQLLVAQESDMSQLAVNAQTDQNFWTVELANNTYYWQYRAKKFNSDWEEWSNIMQFTIDV